MTTYIALLRGINVGGQKKIIMADLRLKMEKYGFQDVVTYIQSGNIVFKSSGEDKRQLELTIHNGIQKSYGFGVSVLVKTRTDLKEVLQHNPFNGQEAIEGIGIYFVLLKNEPEEALVDTLKQETFENEKFAIRQDCIYLASKKGYGKGKCDNNFFEKRLKVSATTRNYKTMMKLLELASG